MGPFTFPPKTHMIHNNNITNDGFAIRGTGHKRATKRISTMGPSRLNGKKTNLGMGYGKSVHGVLSAAVPASLYKEIVLTCREEKINISDLIRRGVMREIGAIRFSRSLKLDPATYGAGAQPEAKETRKPVEKPKNKAKLKAKLRAILKELN